MRTLVFSIVLLIVALVRVPGATFSESFSVQPDKWETWNAGPFAWDGAAANLKVTWDSRKTNSFFYYKAPFALTRADAFAVELTLRLDDLVLGIDPTKPATFPICFGFLNLADARRTNYFRGSGVSSSIGPRSIAEFTYFPDAGLGATVGMALVSTNNQFVASHSFPVELTLGDLFRVKMSYDPASQVMSMQLFRNGEAYGEAPDNSIDPLPYPSRFGDFRLDAFSITSYSDTGQNPPQFAGSVLAHGIIDDVIITWPDPPITTLHGIFQGNGWIVQFSARLGWNYFLERSADLENWDRVANATGREGPMELLDADPLAAMGFYRVVAERL